MDCKKIGGLIARLRKEQNLTQRDVAGALNISNKTVSKWECGLGCPDVSLWAELSAILGAEIQQLMEGEITPNAPDKGNLDRVRFYVCPVCGNILTSTGGATVFCCGRKLERLQPQGEAEALNLKAELVDVDYYVTFDHPMTREHYMLFGAYVRSDSVVLRRLYPEQEASLRLPYARGGKLYLYCAQHGLTVHTLD